MAKVNVTLSLSSTDLFAKQTLSFTETDSLTPVGDQHLIGKILSTGVASKDNIATKALAGSSKRAYLYVKNISVIAGEYLKLGRCVTHGTDSGAGDWFATLGPGEFLFLPIADMEDIDVEPKAGNPAFEYIVMEVAV